MAETWCRGCPDLSILAWDSFNKDWVALQANLTELAGNNAQELVVSATTDIYVALASANQIRGCPRCRDSLTEAFGIPRIWWSNYCQNSNGYLGSDIITENGMATGLSTWAYFETKKLENNMQYEWHKLNVFIRWLGPSGRTIVLVFDPKPHITKEIQKALQYPDPSCSRDPFWVYARLAGIVVQLQDEAVWAIRDQVRMIEKAGMPPGKPQPDYRHLHDIARHAIHVSESLDVARDTLQGIMEQHADFLGRNFDGTTAAATPTATLHLASEGVRRQLGFCRTMLGNLRHRSASNRERLQNELQLAFHTVAQHDAGVSVQIGRAAQRDGAAMKTIAFLTATFLPATFLSAVFSMSFFDYEASEDIWTVSSQFWVYWAFAIPTTMITFLLWHFWHKISPPTPVG